MRNVKHILVNDDKHLTATEKKHIKYLIENGYINFETGLTSATANNKKYFFYENGSFALSGNIMDLTVRIEEKQKAYYYEIDGSGNPCKVLKNCHRTLNISVFTA